MELIQFAACRMTLGITRREREELEREAPAFPFEHEAPREAEVKAFLLGRTPVTHEEYLAFVEADGYADERYWQPDEAYLQSLGSRESFVDQTGRPGPLSWSQGRPPVGRERHPVHGVSWFEARAYCRFVKRRLPSDAEWERAARGTEGLRYPWGDEFDPARSVVGRSHEEGTADVESCPKGATAEGVLHLAGNVAEWVDDGSQDDVVDGFALERFVRNDFYGGAAITVRGSVRTPHSPLTRIAGFGIRVADTVLDLRLSMPLRS